MKRKKRLLKGIASIKKQIKIHEEKKEKAAEEGDIDLENYYKIEIDNLTKIKKRKEELSEKN